MDTPHTTASELYIQLGIAEPFKEWIAQQPGFDQFESFYGKLPGGALGKDYKLTAEQAALLTAEPPKAPIKPKVTPKPIAPPTPPKAAKKTPMQQLPDVKLPDGYYSIEQFTRTMFGVVLPDKRAKQLGLSLSAIARRTETQLEKVPHPVWGSVHAYPKVMLDRFFGVKAGKKKTVSKQPEINP